MTCDLIGALCDFCFPVAAWWDGRSVLLLCPVVQLSIRRILCESCRNWSLVRGSRWEHSGPCDEIEGIVSHWLRHAVESSSPSNDCFAHRSAYSCRVCLQNGDVVCHKVHRHEPSVPEPGLHVLPCRLTHALFYTHSLVTCVHSNARSWIFFCGVWLNSRDDIVAVSKGAIPVHSSGRYRRNTLVHIISQPPYNLPGLLPVHRLDRVTTGVCLLARTKAAARGLAAEIAASRGSSSSMPPQKPTPNLGDKNPADDHTLPEVKRMRLSQPLTATVSPKPANGTPMSGVELAQADAATPVRKEYLAKVCGIFPETLVRCDLPLSLHPTTRDAFVDHGPKGKPAITLFRRLAVVSSEAREPCLHEGGGGTRDAEFSKKTVGDTAEEHCSSKCQADVASIVLAIPLTGRTHQIRIHLQALGHPIVDDPLYSATSSVGSDAKQSAKTYKFADPMSTRQRQIRAANPVPAKISSDTTACDAAFRDNECCAHCPNLEPVDAYVA